MAEERLQKILAAAGLGSRRKCETIISEGRITVNGRIVRQMGSKADPDVMDIRCDGVRIRVERKVYFLLNKPKGYVTTSSDELGRPKITDLLAGRVGERVFPVGRLDEDSEGLIILTNDGEFANLMSHPRYGIRKTYMVVVSGKPSEDALSKVSSGVWLSEGKTGGAEIRVIKKVGPDTLLHVTMGEGRNREIRRVFAKVGHKVRKLMRISIGGCSDEQLKPGRFRPLRPEEVSALRSRARVGAGKQPTPGHVPMRVVRREIEKRYRADAAGKANRQGEDRIEDLDSKR